MKDAEVRQKLLDGDEDTDVADGLQHAINATDTSSVVLNQHEEPPSDDVKTPAAANVSPVSYKRRWYVLILYSYIGFLSNLIWNTWGPISDSAMRAFNWSDGEIALLADWGPVTFLISSFFLAWLMDVKGLRVATLVMAGATCVGSILRCFTTLLPRAPWLIHGGHIVNNLGGPVAMAGPPLLSVVWFPANQRSTATGLSTSLGNLGVAASFLLGPYLVREYKETNTTMNTTREQFTTGLHQFLHNSTGSNNIPQIKQEIHQYMLIVAGMAAAGFLAVLIYFPKAPPTPPSQTATVQRMPYKEGIKRIFRPGMFWILCIPYVIGSGFYNMWGSVIDVIVSPIGIDQKTAGWMGFYGVLAAQISQILVGRFSDIFARRMKLFLLLLYTISLLSFVGFALICSKIVPYRLWAVYVTYILINISQTGAVPLFYELVCEVLYPVSEGIANTVLTTLNNLFGLMFTIVLLIPHIGTAWMNWTLAGAMALSLPILCLFKEHYGRLDIDFIDVTVTDDKDTHSPDLNKPAVQNTHSVMS